MKFSLVLVLTLAVVVAQELVCNPGDPSDCYPQIFEPTDQWQQIRPGQDIPPGLHVRLNIDTLQKEAKLDDGRNTEDTGMVVVPEMAEQVENTDESVSEKIEKLEHALDKLEHVDNVEHEVERQFKKVNIDEVNDLESSVSQLSYFLEDSNYDLLEKALDNLVDLSHDLDFGVRLTQSKSTFDNLLTIARTVTLDDVREKVFRIMGATLRNNPEAISNLLEKQTAGFMELLFHQLRTDLSDVVKKRVLGVIQALVSNSGFNFNYFNNDNEIVSIGINELVQVFPKAQDATRTRIVNIFEDLNMVPTLVAYDKRSIEESASADNKYSKLLQHYLSNAKTNSEDQFQLFFNNLVDLHTGNSKIAPPESKFIEWLSEEAHTRSKRENAGDFDKNMLRARHEVFGNPNGMRKALFDEL